jgi:hypothetical protein
MKNSAVASIPSWVNFPFTGRKSDLFAASIPSIQGIIEFGTRKCYEDYRFSKSEKTNRRVKEEILAVEAILDYVVPKLTPMQRRGLLWGMVRNQFLFNIREKLYKNRGRDYVSVRIIGYNSLWEYPIKSSEFYFWEEVPSGIDLSASKECPRY